MAKTYSIKVLILFLLAGSIQAQLSGTFNVPLTYTSIAAAINDLNSQGVSGPVTINISAGYSEVAPIGGYALTATGTSLNPITFVKFGIGSNPLITAYSGGTGTPSSANQDGIWRLIGCDYITIDGISLDDPNVSNPSTMEYGFGFFKLNANDGCQNNTIQNCSIKLNRLNNATGAGPSVDGSRGINVLSSLSTAQTTALNPSSSTGSNSYNKFYNNTIQNCNIGIALIGFAVGSPYTFADIGNEIGSSLAFTGNTIKNYGGAVGATNAAAAIRTLAQYDLRVYNNQITNNDGTGVNHPTSLRGIYLNTAVDANASVFGNTLTLSSDANSAILAAIENVSGSAGTTNSITISGNLISNCTNTANTSGTFYGIYNNAASCAFLEITNNVFSTINLSATSGSAYFIYNTGAITSVITVTNNQLSSLTNSASTSGNFFGIYSNAVSSAWLNISSNIFSNNLTFASSGAFYGIYNSSAINNSITIQNNSILNSSHIATSNGSYFGFFNNGIGGNELNMSLNSYASNTLVLQNGSAYFVYNNGANSTNILLSDNSFINSTTTFNSTGSFYSIYNNTAGVVNLHINDNTYTGNTHAATSGSVQILFNRGTATNTFNTVSFAGNLISNCTFSATINSPFLGIYNSGVLTNSLAMIQNTISSIDWLGTNSARYLIYNTGSVTTREDINLNTILNCNSNLNTTGIFYGILSTGAVGSNLNICENSFSTLTNKATSGGTYLIYNTGIVFGGAITMTANTINAISNTATGNGVFYGLYNNGSNHDAFVISNTAFTNCNFVSSGGAVVYMNHNGPANASITNIAMTNNLISSCSVSNTTNGATYGIYNSTSSSQSLTISNNTFTNCVYNAVNGSNYLLYNSGGLTSTFSVLSMNANKIDNCTFSSNGTSPFYTIWNNGVNSSITSISNNSITNSNWNTISSLKYLVSNIGVSATSANLDDNIFSNCNFTTSTSGSLYGIYNSNTTSSSSGNISIRTNTFTNILRTASTGETHFINVSGSSNNIYNSISIENNILTACSTSITGTGALYGVYNNSASSNSLSVNNNTIIGNSFGTFNGASYLVYTRGIASTLLSEVNFNFNLISNNTSSISSSGAYYGFYISGVGTSTCANLSMSNNTFTNTDIQSTNGSIYLFYASCPVTNSILINSNNLGSVSNTLSTTGTFYGINNASSSLTGDLFTRNNLFTNLNSCATTGARYLIYNGGGRGNAIYLENNLVSNCVHNVLGSASYFTINNNSASTGSLLSITNNTLSANITSLTTGSNYYILNSGALSTLINTVNLTHNVIENYTLVATSGQFLGITNTGITADNLSISSNSISGIERQAVAGNQQLFVNSGRVNNSILINSNLVTSYSSSLNTSGAFYGINNSVNFSNGNYPINLNIGNNKFLSSELSSTTGQIYFIYNTAAASNTIINCNILTNEISNQNHTVTAGATIYGIYSSAISYSNLTVSSNSITNILANTATSNRHLIFNNGIVLGAASYSNNFISNYTSTVNTTGNFYGIMNQGNSKGILSVFSNSIINLNLNSSTGVSYLVYNTMTMDDLQLNANHFAYIKHTSSSSGTFYGIFNQVNGANSLAVNLNSFSNVDISTTFVSNYFIYINGVASNTIGTVDLSGNSISNYSLQSNSGGFFGIYNTGLTAGTLSVNNNSVINANVTATNSSCSFFQNTGIVQSNLDMNGNYISAFSNSLNTNGSHNYFYNRGNVGGNLSISSNTVLNQVISSNNASATVIYNTGLISNSLSVNANVVSSFNHSATGSALLSNIYNYSGSSAYLSINANSFNNFILTSNSGSFYHIYNRASSTSNIVNLNITNNVLSGLDFNTGIGSLYGIYNNGFNFSNLSVSGNSLVNISTTSSTSPRYMIFNNGSGSNAIMMDNNLVSNYTSTLNTTGLFYDLLNSGSCSGNFSANNNRFLNHALSSSTGSVFTIQNSGAINNAISISNNNISGLTYTSGSASFSGINNTLSNATQISVSTNSLMNISISNSLSSKYLIYNASNASNLIQLNANLISAYTNTGNISGANYGVYNSGSSFGNIDVSSNILNGIAISSSAAPSYFVYNSGSSSTGSNLLKLSSNTFSNLNVSTNTGSMMVCYNSGNSSGMLEFNNNQFVNSTFTHSIGDIFVNINTGTVSGTISFTNNSIVGSSFLGGADVNWYGICNQGDGIADMDISQNSISSSVVETGLGSSVLVSNTGNILSNLSMNTNSISNFSLINSYAGDLFAVVNSASVSAGLNMNSNSLNNLSISTTTGNVSLISNSGNVPNAISFLSNSLSCGFTNTLTDFSGNFNGIVNTGGVLTTSVQVVNNNFSNVNFSGATGSGNLFFIHNANNNDLLNISGNTWTNLNMNHSGNQHLIFNPSSTQSNLSVLGNSIVSAYARSGNAGSMYVYYANGNSPSTCIQNYSNNNFSNITASTPGTGSFYGLYSSDGSSSPYPQKTVSNNIFSNINYKGLGFLFAYYFDYLGDGNSSSGSSVSTNTLSNITWSGPIYGLSIGTTLSPNYATGISGNVILNINTDGQNAENNAVYLSVTSGTLNLSKNKISDIYSNGTSASASGLYVGGAGYVLASNNLIGNIFTPSSSAINALNGIYAQGSGTLNLLFNTVYLNSLGNGTNFGSNAFYSTTNTHINLQNNIFINLSNPNGSGISSALRLSSSALSNYSASSNNNVFYAGIPSNNKVLFYDGTSAKLTLPSLQAAVSPRESVSATESTPFISTVGNSNSFLHIDFSIPSITDNGASNSGGITNDYDLDVRQGNVGYLGIGSAPDIGADEYNPNLTPCSSVNSGTALITTSSLVCSGETAYMLASGASAAGGIVYQWQVSSSSGGPYTNVSGGNGPNTVAYTTPSLSSGTFYYILATTCTLNSQTASSNELTLTVNQTPTANISGPSSALCAGEDLILSTSANSSNTFSWLGPNNFTSSIQSPTITNASTNAGGTYSLLVTNLNCAVMAPVVSVTVNPTPPQFLLTPNVASLCAGSSQTIAASIPITNPTLNFGNQTYQNSASGYPAPYSVYYGGQKMQMLVLAGELASVGFTTGTPIGSLQFAVNSLGTNWGSSLMDCKDFQISLKTTSVTQLFTFETGLTTVYGPVNYTPSVGPANTHNFTSPFIWDGTSNLIIEVLFSNNLIGSSANAVIQNNSPTSFQSTLVYRGDNQSVTSISAATASNTNIGFVRPDFILNGTQVGTYSWSPSNGLSSTITSSVIASPSLSTLYTASLSNGQCASSASINLSVILTPTLTISSSSSLVCLGNTSTLTANGATSYTWSNNSTSNMIVVSPIVNTTYTVSGSNPACPNASDTITIFSAPALVLTSTMSPPTLCQGKSATITVAGANTYTWTFGSNSNSISVTPSLTTNFVVNANSGSGCWASKTILAKVNPLPFISISPSSATICPGQTITLEASGVFSYTWAPLNSNAPIIEISPSVTTVYSVTGVDINMCTNSASMQVTVDPCVSVSELETNVNVLTIYPNPTEGKLSIQFIESGLKFISLINTLGAELMQIQCESQIEILDISLFNKGVYFLKISQNGQSSTHKIILN